MKFFVSDNTKTNNKFGKWYYWHDDKCNVITKQDCIILYYGYAIEESLEDKVNNDWDNVKDVNGSYCCCKITKDKVEVLTDYFDTSKIFYNLKNGIEITNTFRLLTLDKKDIDLEETARRRKLPDTYSKSGVFTGGNWLNYHPLAMREHKFKERCPTTCKTVFKTAFQLQSQHKLVVDTKVKQIRLHDIHRDIQSALQAESKFETIRELQNYIVNQMKSHAQTIKSQYKNVACTLSEGIDSTLQNMFFPEAKQYSYHVVNPETVKLAYKKELYDKLNFKNVIIGEFDNMRSQEYALKYAKDPTAYYYDFLPLYPMIKDADDKPDVLLVGSNADEMFMHRVDYLASEVYEMMWQNDPTTASAKTKEWLDENSNCYSTRKNIDDEQPYWANLFDKENESDAYWHSCPNHFIESLSYKAACGLYSRHLSHELELPVTSLYQDRSICFEIMKLPLAKRIDVTKDCSIQKAILKDTFNVDFKTPYKDNASYNTYPPVTKWYNITIPYVLKDHLSENM